MEYKIKQNMFYQVIYQICILITPLIVSPYISRKLGVDNLGIYSYTNSIVAYFSLFSQLGISNHGSRSISKVKNDTEKRNKLFWNIYFIQVMATFLSAICFAIFYSICDMDYKNILTAQALTLVANLLDISWLFYGMECFKLTSIRGCIVKIASVIAILTFVNDKNDLLNYTVIMALSCLISAVILWYSVYKIIGLPQIDIKLIKENIRPIFVLFIPVLASSIYHIIDKTMLGNMSTYQELGYYYNADKVVNIPIGIFTGISTVMMPFLSRKTVDTDNILKESFKINFIIAIAMAFGILAVVEEFVPIFFGTGYEKCVLLIKLFIPIFLIKILSMFTRMQIIIPRCEDKIYLYAVICGAVVNVIANFFLITRFGSVGAVIATFIAEFVVCIIQCIKTQKYFSYKMNIVSNFAYILIGIIMFGVIKCLEKINCALFLKLLLEIIIGGGIYVLFCMIKWKKYKS